MKLFKYVSVTLLALSFSNAALAEVESPHSVGLQVGGGGIKFKGVDSNGEGLGQSYLYYNYKFSPNYYLELGLMGGEDVNDWDCEKDSDDQWACYSGYHQKTDLQIDNFEYSALVVALKTDLSLSKRNSLYGKVGVSYYDYELDLEHSRVADDKGIGLFLEAGWEYRWDMGIGMNIGLQHQKMNDLKANTFNIGISYSF